MRYLNRLFNYVRCSWGNLYEDQCYKITGIGITFYYHVLKIDGVYVNYNFYSTDALIVREVVSYKDSFMGTENIVSITKQEFNEYAIFK